jgi:8-oxo-dGTP pyrophosphatase MutT (NUDIX family)
VLLTRRASHLRQHAGQISFPGGRAEAGDAGPSATALREAHEEVGLPPGRVRVIGQLPAYRTITNFSVVPVVGLVHAPFETALDPNEADEAFEVPLSFLMNPAHHCHHAIEVGGHLRKFLSITWHTQADDGVRREYFIWGATAAMLRNLYRFLAG